jgi:nucleotide-binding universal stress UspA family protein
MQEMKILLGLDPGGSGNFGWCIAADSETMPVEPIASGLADNSHMAIANALAAIPDDGVLVAAGIDAPLFWSRIGSRNADVQVRRAIRLAGAPHASGTVQDMNSLKGACLAQGLLAAVTLREMYPALPITEAHPKALRWLLPEAALILGRSEHERDALLAAIAAWAISRSVPGWQDLFPAEPHPFTPVSPPLHYYMPGPVLT